MIAGFLVAAADPADTIRADVAAWSPIITALIGVAGGAFGALAAGRSKRRRDAETTRKEHQEDRQAFIDQIQEERNTYAQLMRDDRAAYRAERVENDARLDRMWADKAASREYVANLRAHIHNGAPPPPPGPPEGYIE